MEKGLIAFLIIIILGLTFVIYNNFSYSENFLMYNPATSEKKFN